MALVTPLIVQRQINNVIKRFKFEELENAVMPIFSELSWNRLRSKLIKRHKNFTTTNAVRIIEEAIENANLTPRDLQDRLAMLEVIDISRHDKKKIWYGYELTGLDKPVTFLGKREIEESIKDEFHTSGSVTNVKVLTYDNITFVCIKEKKKRQKLQAITMPFFFALFLEHKYFFCSRKNISHDFIKVIATTLGYKNGKRIKLMGKDLRSLIRLLWSKQQGALHVDGLKQSPVYEGPDYIVKDIGIDYTQAKQRKDYTKRCFGKDPPTLELLAINGPRESIQHHKLASLLPSIDISMNWDFHSNNIARFLTNLVEKRVFEPPLPPYVSNFMVAGKNELTLQIG